MRFKKNSRIYTKDGEKVGTIDRVVLDPSTKEVSHIVVREGLIFTEDKVIPTDLIDSATETQIILKKDKDSLPELPKFQKIDYVSLSQEEQPESDQPVDDAEPVYWYPALGTIQGGYFGVPYMGTAIPMHTVRVRHNIPEGTIPLKEGAKVVTADEEHVGDVERIFTHPETEQITHFVVSEGLFFKDRKLIPTFWANKIEATEIQLAVDSELLDKLPEYER